MSQIQKKDVDLLLNAGFTMEELGLIPGCKQGVEIYESPEDYFARELIQNACENGTIDLMDEFLIHDEEQEIIPYDRSHKGLYDDHEYDGNEDWNSDVLPELREQAEWLKTIKIGKMSIWQRKNPKGQYEWAVRRLNVEIPEEDRERYKNMSREYQKELWLNYARDEWKKAWEFALYSLKSYPIEEKIEVITKNGYNLNIMIISADNVRKEGYKNLPSEARWIGLCYFEKNIK